MGATAQLIADGGAAAESDDFFRSRAFLAAERDHAHAARRLAGPRGAGAADRPRGRGRPTLLDAISPYGYPGATVEGRRAAAASGDGRLVADRLVSVFARERLAAEPWLGGSRRALAGARPRPGPAASGPRPRLAEQIRANARDGWAVETPRWPRVLERRRPRRFRLGLRADDAPRRRRGALLLRPRLLRRGAAVRASWLLSARRHGELGAGAIAATSDGVLHYFLGGTADDARAASPFKNVVAAMLDLADELELPLNLGGGVVAGDGLEAFKRGFANSELPFRTHELVCDAPRLRAPGAPGDDRRASFPPTAPEPAIRLYFGTTPPSSGAGGGGSTGSIPPAPSIRAWTRRRSFGISAPGARPGRR